MTVLFANIIVDTLVRILIIASGVTVAILDFVYYFKYHNDGWRWIKMCYAILGTYWAGLYTYLSILPLVENRLEFAQVFIRLPLLLTLSVMTAGAIIRHRSKSSPKGRKS
jgi:hypothetical protein